MQNRKKFQIVFDMGLNICATAAPIAILQLLVYPYIARKIDTDAYGLMITMYSVWSVVSNSLGNVLNNIRLLRNKDYEEANNCGDFNVLLFKWTALNIIVIGIATLLYGRNQITIIDVVFSILIATFMLLKAYVEVGFRIQLNYINILINGILQCVGFGIGLLVFVFTGIWQFVFLCGFMFSFLFAAVKTSLLRESRQKTGFYEDIKKDSNLLAVATFSGSLMSYADKMVLYPLMGGHAVSVYYTATILGKIVSMVSGPITSVILSYISRWDKSKRNVFSRIVGIGAIFALIGYILTMLISRPVIGILFPQWIDEVMLYLPITTIAIVIQTLNSFLNPFVLKFYDIKWQIVINLTSLGVYFIGAVTLWNLMGMIGFCIGTVIGQLSKTFIMLALHFFGKKSD